MSREIIGLCDRADKWSTAYGASRTTESRFWSSSISLSPASLCPAAPTMGALCRLFRCFTQNPHVLPIPLNNPINLNNNTFYLSRVIASRQPGLRIPKYTQRERKRFQTISEISLKMIFQMSSCFLLLFYMRCFPFILLSLILLATF